MLLSLVFNSKSITLISYVNQQIELGKSLKMLEEELNITCLALLMATT